MSLKDLLSPLPKSKQLAIVIRLIKLALPVWDKYAEKNELVYRDSVVGLSHKVDINLPTYCIKVSEDYLKANWMQKIFTKNTNEILGVQHKFREPITALQDRDWELPYEVERIFYAVYNLICSLNGEDTTVFGESTVYVAINQAVDALSMAQVLDINEINEILKTWCNH